MTRIWIWIWFRKRVSWYMTWKTWELKLNSTILTLSKSKLMLILSILIVIWWIWIIKLHLWYFVTFGVAYCLLNAGYKKYLYNTGRTIKVIKTLWGKWRNIMQGKVIDQAFVIFFFGEERRAKGKKGEGIQYHMIKSCSLKIPPPPPHCSSKGRRFLASLLIRQQRRLTE